MSKNAACYRGYRIDGVKERQGRLLRISPRDLTCRSFRGPNSGRGKKSGLKQLLTGLRCIQKLAAKGFADSDELTKRCVEELLLGPARREAND